MNPLECPRCHKINAPLTTFCDCRPETQLKSPISSEHIEDTIRYLTVRTLDRCFICNGFHDIGLQCATLKIT